MLGGLGEVAGLVAAVQNATEYFGVQGLDAPAEYLGEAGEVFHRNYLGPLLFEKLLGAARGVERHAEAAQRGHERGQPVFVVHGKQGGANGPGGGGVGHGRGKFRG